MVEPVQESGDKCCLVPAQLHCSALKTAYEFPDRKPSLADPGKLQTGLLTPHWMIIHPFEFPGEGISGHGERGILLKESVVKVQRRTLQQVYQVFNMTSMKALRRKSILLTGYLEYLIKQFYTKDPAQPHKPHVSIITPSDPQQRGCQLSLCFSIHIQKVFQELEKRGVACDMREPSVLRIAPVPLYNSFSDVHRFVETLGAALTAGSQ